MKAGASVISKTNLGSLKASLKQLQNAAVYVGIPQDKSLRTEGAITNAQLLFIHSRGSALRGIPARPVIEPAISAPDNKERITAELTQAGHAMLAEQPQQAHAHLVRAGVIGANASKRWFSDSRNNWPPNAESTVEHKGSDRPLIDTGELRRSITYVVKD